ncbi:MAG TPA: MJ0042-type zinc finger domain-containing protein [Planctomycetaceae bacterium]|jgi:predicted Zn finger-like uncharacterized protein
MSIEVICPECDTSHKVKDDAAGKKLRCKSCQKVISIPAAAADEDADPWDNLDENEAGEELPPVIRKPAPTKKKAGKGTRSRSGGGMPITIMVSIGINGLQIAVFVLGMILNLLSANIGGVVGCIVRMSIDYTIIQGLINRRNRLRWNAIILDILGIVMLGGCGGGVLVLSKQPIPALQRPEVNILIGLAITQVVLWITDLVLLFLPASKDWCSE